MLPQCGQPRTSWKRSGRCSAMASSTQTTRSVTAQDKQQQQERDELGFIAHVLEQRIADVECDAA